VQNLATLGTSLSIRLVLSVGAESIAADFLFSHGFNSGGGVANHPRCYETLAEFFFPRGFDSGGGAVNHPCRRGSTRLGAEVGSTAAAGVICDTSAATKS
jgi:hypothetical protein